MPPRQTSQKVELGAFVLASCLLPFADISCGLRLLLRLLESFSFPFLCCHPCKGVTPVCFATFRDPFPLPAPGCQLPFSARCQRAPFVTVRLSRLSRRQRKGFMSLGMVPQTSKEKQVHLKRKGEDFFHLGGSIPSDCRNTDSVSVLIPLDCKLLGGRDLPMGLAQL